jgi:hypothetical protein
MSQARRRNDRTSSVNRADISPSCSIAPPGDEAALEESHAVIYDPRNHPHAKIGGEGGVLRTVSRQSSVLAGKLAGNFRFRPPSAILARSAATFPTQRSREFFPRCRRFFGASREFNRGATKTLAACLLQAAICPLAALPICIRETLIRRHSRNCVHSMFRANCSL